MTSDKMLDQREDVLDEFDDRVDPSHGVMTLAETRWFTAQLLADEVVRLRNGTPTVYYIVKRGVYDHGLIGMYRTLDEAKARCEQHTNADRRDGDGYHDYVIHETSIGADGKGEAVAVWQGKMKWEECTRLPGEYTWREATSEDSEDR